MARAQETLSQSSALHPSFHILVEALQRTESRDDVVDGEDIGRGCRFAMATMTQFDGRFFLFLSAMPSQLIKGPYPSQSSVLLVF